MSQLIPCQLRFRQAIPEVVGNIDYQIFRDNLERIDELIREGNLDFESITYLIKEAELEKKKESSLTGKPVKPVRKKEIIQIQKIAREALRCTISRQIVGEPYRPFSAHIADSVLLQRFCGLDQWGSKTVKVPSKSSLQRYEDWIPEKLLREIIMKLTTMASQTDKKGVSNFGLAEAIRVEDYYGDLRVIKTNIHFPTDWVLLIDAVRTLSKALIWIRKSGIKNRMKCPEEFMRHARRRKESKKTRWCRHKIIDIIPLYLNGGFICLTTHINDMIYRIRSGR